MTKIKSISDAYYSFCQLFGKSQPIWNIAQFRLWLEENELNDYSRITEDDLELAFDEAFNWSYMNKR